MNKVKSRNLRLPAPFFHEEMDAWEKSAGWFSPPPTLIGLNINFFTFPNIVCVGGWGGDGSGHLFFFFVVMMKKSTENITIRQYKIMLGVYVSENCTQLSVNWIIICYHWCWKDEICIRTGFPYNLFLRNKGNQKLQIWYSFYNSRK